MGFALYMDVMTPQAISCSLFIYASPLAPAWKPALCKRRWIEAGSSSWTLLVCELLPFTMQFGVSFWQNLFLTSRSIVESTWHVHCQEISVLECSTFLYDGTPLYAHIFHFILYAVLNLILLCSPLDNPRAIHYSRLPAWSKDCCSFWLLTT